MTEADLVVRTSLEGYRAYAAHAGTTALRRGAVEAIFTGIEYEGLNAIWAGAGWTEDDIRAALAWRPELPALFHVGPTADASREPVLLAHGLVFYEEEPGMIAPTSAPSPPDVAGLAIEQPDDLDELAAILTGGSDTDFRRRLAALRSLPVFDHLVGRLDGRAVATAAVFHGDSASEIQHVVTLADARRRGIGAAMTAAALDLCRRRGREVAVLTSSPEGVRVYERLGFRRVCAVRRFLRERRP